MAGTRAWSLVVDHARQRGAKIVCCGDANQLDPVPAGGAFHHLTRRYPAARLTTPLRQHERAEADALRHLQGGRDPEHYLEHKARRGELQLAPSRDAALVDAASWWADHARRDGPAAAVVITRTNELREQLNHTLRTQHATHGGLHGAMLEAAGRIYQPGDRVLLRHNEPELGAANGTRGTITVIDAARRAATVRADDGTTLQLPASYLDAGHLEHGYCLTAHALQGATVRHALVVSHPDDHSAQWTLHRRQPRPPDHHAPRHRRRTSTSVTPTGDARPLEASRRLANAMRLDEHDSVTRLLAMEEPRLADPMTDRGLGIDR